VKNFARRLRHAPSRAYGDPELERYLVADLGPNCDGSSVFHHYIAIRFVPIVVAASDQRSTLAGDSAAYSVRKRATEK
jgi:hypothetical protein